MHNGIIENHAELRAELEAAGQEFSTETDTETVAQLVDLNLQRGMAPVEAAGAAFRRLEGAYALAMIFAGHPELIDRRAARRAAGGGVRRGRDVRRLRRAGAGAADPPHRLSAAMATGRWWTGRARASSTSSGAEVEREVKLTRLTGAAIGKGNFRHFMEKELHEHPAVIGDTLHRMVNPGDARGGPARAAVRFRVACRASRISACGSAFYAGLVGRWWFEAIARIPTDGDVASEFRYRTPPLPPGGLGLLVSPVGRDRRYAGGAALHARAGPARAVDR